MLNTLPRRKIGKPHEIMQKLKFTIFSTEHWELGTFAVK